MLGFLKKVAKNRKNTTDTALATANTDVAIASTALRYSYLALGYSYPSSVLAHLTVITQQVLYFLQKYPTIEAFYKVFNPQRMVFICQDPQYCIFGPSPTLAQIDIMYGPLTSAKWLVPLIADVSLSCGLKEDVSESQLQFTAVAISNRYRWLKAGEMMLFFFNFKAGFYERFYSYFDTQTIIRSFKSFLDERALAIAAHERET